jgi:cell wall-associated NlpC family hydrolase
MRGNQPVTDLLDAPHSKRISQLLFGESFEVEKTEGAYSFGHMQCGYQGWLPSSALAEPRTASHSISALATFVYAAPDMKSEVRLRLPFGAKVKVSGTEGQFAKLPEGYVFATHLSQATVPDYVATAERFLGVPYLWGGRSSLGIDCSGLAQMALHSAGIKSLRDSGPQAKRVGEALDIDAPLRRGDLVFWKGHVGLMQDSKTLLHATAFSMTVLTEPLETTVARVKAQGYGDITTIRRIERQAIRV